MHPPPRSGFRRLSWGCAVLRGLKRTHLGRVWVAPVPYGVFTPRGHSASAPSPSRSCGRPPMDFRSPTELDHRDPAPSRRQAGKSDDTSSPGLLLPYDTCQAGGFVDQRRIPPPPRAACGVWLPPARLNRRPWRRDKRTAAPMGFSLQGLPLVTIGAPLGARALMALPRHGGASPEGSVPRRWPTSGPCSRDESVLTPGTTSDVPAVDPFLGFAPPERAPARPGARFDHGASPLGLWRLYV